jgi:hypothetical protein
MPINLTISAETVEEFDTLLERFMPAHDAAKDTASGEDTAPAEIAARRRSKKTDAPLVKSAPHNQRIAVDFSAQNADAGAAASPAEEYSAPAETVASTPAATSPADTAAAAAGEVTVQQLKDAMADLLKAKSASFAMQTLEAATGCRSLTTGSPSVVEKAKTDPALMQKTLNALIAAKA